jgi:hypothetical protein
VHFGPFRFGTKVDAKLAEQLPLSHMFAKQSRVTIFRNERTRSTPLDPKHMFWAILDRFVTARKLMQNCRTGAMVTARKSRRNFLQLTHLIHSIAPKTHVLGCFGPFRYCWKVDAKLAELVPLTHKFAKQSRVTIFRNERSRSTPLDPKLIFWGTSDCLITTLQSMQNWPN